MGLDYLKLLVLELLAVMLPLLRGDQLPLRHLYLLLWVQDQLLLRLDQLVVKLPLPLLPPLLLSPSMPLSIIMLPIPLLLYYAFYPAMYAAIALACSVPSTLHPPFTTLAVPFVAVYETTATLTRSTRSTNTDATNTGTGVYGRK
nr:hypothetical protein Q903MT_gene2403 [Picea sitchensis]